MLNVSNAKRLLAIIEILEQNTDEEHELSVSEIIEKLKMKFGSDYHVSRNTIKNTIEELIDTGLNIETRISDNEPINYSHQDRKFEIYQLRILIDAVSSAKFLTAEESNELIEKIKTLTSKHLSRKLNSHIRVDPSLKAKNNEIRYIIDNIHTAINEKRKISFQYGKYNVKKEFFLRNNGQRYIVTPLALVWNHEFYYLVAKHNEKMKHFRIDRMRRIERMKETFVEPTFDIVQHMKNSFNMFTGEPEYVELQFNLSLINTILNHFGTDVYIKNYDENTFTIKVQAYINEGFLRWLLTWGSDVKVAAPEQLKDQLKEEIKKLQSLYE